ncbi:AraC family transcriptional regulator, partial [bacterium]
MCTTPDHITARLKSSQHFAARQLPLDSSRHILKEDYVPHDHDFFEIAFISGGTGKHLSAQGEQEVAVGDGWVLAPGAWHAYRDCEELVVHNCNFGLPLLERELVALRHDAASNHLFFTGPLALERRGLIAFHLEGAAFEAFLESWHAFACAKTDLQKVARLLLFLDHLTSSFGSSHREAPEKKLHSAAIAAMKLLENEPAHNWSLDELARQLHLAPGYLARVFKTATGLSPISWLHRLRAERAAQLLLQTAQPVAEIGAQVGWDDPNLFARRFRAAHGVSASIYRSRFRSGGEAPPED